MSAASEVARRVASLEPRCGETLVIAVDGRAGAGKTTFGEALAAEMGAAHLDIENTYPGWDGLEEGARLAREELLEPVATGRPGALPQWDWLESRPGEPLVVAPPAFLVLSGTGSGATANGTYLSLLVWMELDDDERRRRALERDGELFELHWDRWSRQVEEHLAREQTRERAGAVVDTSGAAPVLVG